MHDNDDLEDGVEPSPPPKKETAEELLAKIHKFLAENSKAIEVAGTLDSKSIETITKALEKRPIGWSETTVTPYYNEKHGLKVLAVFKKLLDDQVDYYWDCFKLRLNVKTFMQQFHQGWRWLRERHPDENIRKFAQEIKDNKLLRIDKNGNRGVRMAIIQPDINEFLAAATPVKSLSTVTWKTDLDKFLETAQEGHKKVFKGLILDFNDKEYIKNALTLLPEFQILNLEDTKFTIARLPKELLGGEENIKIPEEIFEDEEPQILEDPKNIKNSIQDDIEI